MSNESCLTENEGRALATQFAKARGEKGFSADEFAALLADAERIRRENVLLDLIIRGRFICDWNGKEIMMKMMKKND